MQLKSWFWWWCVLALLIPNCRSGPDANSKKFAETAFYYWQTTFEPDSTTHAAITLLGARHLYVRLFDVDWNSEAGQAMPVGLITWAKQPTPQILITPVVFITTRVLDETAIADLDSLAAKISRLMQLTCAAVPKLSGEVQVDCDWNERLKEKYFYLLKQLRKTSFFLDKTLSVTVRLHQVKYLHANGVPPAERGLLMCYNMGNLRKPEAVNSIIDAATFKSYTERLSGYPLPLDIALPLFDWWVWFGATGYQGLIHAGNLPDSFKTAKPYKFAEAATVGRYAFAKGDWLRYENSPLQSLQEVVDLLPAAITNGKHKLLFFHADSSLLSRYALSDLKALAE
jgi:hypothetical protein